MTQESQSEPRRQRSAHQAPAAAAAGLANTSLQRLHSLVNTSPRVAQLKVLQRQEGPWACEECIDRKRGTAAMD